METVSFEQVVSRGCGLDVHKETVVATIDGEGLEAFNPRIWNVHEFFDRIERLVSRKQDYSRSNGEYGYLLETRL